MQCSGVCASGTSDTARTSVSGIDAPSRAVACVSSQHSSVDGGGSIGAERAVSARVTMSYAYGVGGIVGDESVKWIASVANWRLAPAVRGAAAVARLVRELGVVGFAARRAARVRAGEIQAAARPPRRLFAAALSLRALLRVLACVPPCLRAGAAVQIGVSFGSKLS
jgi:hypothetical protein